MVNYYEYATHTLLHIAIYLLKGPPRFLIHPISQTVTAGMSITLYCNVSGYKVSYVWERRTDGSAWSRISDSQNYKYEVKNIRQSQQYRCIPGNDAKSLISDIAIIQVLSKYTCMDV